MTSRQITTKIATADDLPARYPGSSRPMPNPRFDWCYIQEVGKALKGGVFLDGGTITNAEHARTRLVKAGFMRNWMGGATDEHD